jgi:cytidine deaminase
VSAVDDRLLAAARLARSRAYAPFSRYRVGSALLTRSGKIFAGCNVENSSFGATLCAERNAVAAMVAAGEKDPIVCVVVTSGPKPASPCGICRQVLAEFAHDLDDLRVVMVAEDARGGGRITARKSSRLSALLPQAFRLDR